MAFKNPLTKTVTLNILNNAAGSPVIPIGTTAGIKLGIRSQLDTGYKWAKGLLLWENVNPGVGYQIQVRDDQTIYQDFTNSLDYQATTGTAKKDRYTKCYIKAGQNYVTININLLGTTTAVPNLDMVFICTNEEPDQPELTEEEVALINILRGSKINPIAPAEKIRVTAKY